MKYGFPLILAAYAWSFAGLVVCDCSAAEISDVGASSKSVSPDLENLMMVSEEIYCGGQPLDEKAFAKLASLGIKTVVSVDGSRPDIETSGKHGLRYVHIPIGYDGVEQTAGLSITRVVREIDGPVYFHCHHGRHRGPVAAAIACIAGGIMDRQAALAVLDQAGTSRDYAGLWRAVQTYRVPPRDAELPPLVEVAKVRSFASVMANIDRAFGNLGLCSDAGWKSPPNHPDVIARQQALLVKEGLREACRNLSDDFGLPFRTWLAEAESVAQGLEDALSANNLHAATKHYHVLSKSCIHCHQRYRN